MNSETDFPSLPFTDGDVVSIVNSTFLFSLLSLSLLVPLLVPLLVVPLLVSFISLIVFKRGGGGIVCCCIITGGGVG